MGVSTNATQQKPQNVSVEEAVKCRLMCTKGLIDGKWVDGHKGESFAVTDPATGKQVADVASFDQQNVEMAIRAAVDAHKSWKKTSPRMRSELLKAWYQQLIENAEEIAMITTAESGKPIKESRDEVTYAASFIDYYAHECLHTSGFVVPSSAQDQRMVAVHEPIGVCAIITPWNFPLAMITRKLGPCIAAGCTAIVRPASETPLSALLLARLAQDAGIPAGVINVIPSSHAHVAEVGKLLATSPDIRKLSFTGSTKIGRLLMEQSASTIKRISLELGGNASFIVFEDADLKAAVTGLMSTKFRNNGQTCVCTNRVYLHTSIFEEFKNQLVDQVKRLKSGDPFANDTQLGPLINQSTYKKVQTIVQDALDNGATAVLGGVNEDSKDDDLFYPPTVLVNVNEHMRVCHEEIFGPVIPLFPFQTEQEVIEKANSTDVGLASYFYTRDLARAWRVAGALECGMVGVNTGSISNAQAPFGGVKQSGVGREGSALGLMEYVEVKMINMGGLAI